MADHTPLPWTKKQLRHVCQAIAENIRGDAMAVADGRYIFKTVHCHDDLVEVCRMVEAYANCCRTDPQVSGEVYRKLMDDTQAALAKVKEYDSEGRDDG